MQKIRNLEIGVKHKKPGIGIDFKALTIYTLISCYFYTRIWFTNGQAKLALGKVESILGDKC